MGKVMSPSVTKKAVKNRTPSGRNRPPGTSNAGHGSGRTMSMPSGDDASGIPSTAGKGGGKPANK
jgi:hypothetical protein